MGRIALRVLLLFTIITSAACLIKPPEPVPEPWNQLEDYLNNTNIRLLHASPTELYILSDDEFARINLDNELVEKRRFELPFAFSGRPALSDDSFYQLIRNDSLKLELNFHLTKNPDALYKIKIEDYMQSGDSGFLEEGLARNTGTYNSTGTQFIIPVIQVPDSYYAFFLFDINLNGAKTEIISIDLAARINVDLPAYAGNLNNVKFIDGNFYATSLDGAVRINPSTGSYVKIFEEWMLDFFKHEDKIFATGFGNQLFVSSDNGQTFESVDLSDINQPYQLEMIELENELLLSQQAVGFPFSLIEPDFSSGKRILLNSDFTEDFSAYQDIEYFNGRYYLPVFKELYYTSELLTE